MPVLHPSLTDPSGSISSGDLCGLVEGDRESKEKSHFFKGKLDMHDAAHTMRISDIATSAWLIDFCHKAIEP